MKQIQMFESLKFGKSVTRPGVEQEGSDPPLSSCPGAAQAPLAHTAKSISQLQQGVCTGENLGSTFYFQDTFVLPLHIFQSGCWGKSGMSDFLSEGPELCSYWLHILCTFLSQSSQNNNPSAMADLKQHIIMLSM